MEDNKEKDTNLPAQPDSSEEENAQPNKIKLKGRFKNYMRAPLFIIILLGAATVGSFCVDYKAGIISALSLIIYSVIMGTAYNKIKPVVIDELVNFALDYGQVQRSMLQELEVPYGILDEDGNLLWANAKLEALADMRSAKKGIHNVFGELTTDHMPSDNKKVFYDVSYHDYIFRAELSRISVEDFSGENNLIDTGGKNNILIAMYLFDETRMRKYMKEIQEQRLVAGTIFIDNYEDALNSTEEVRRSLLAALIERKITKYMQGFDAIVHKTEKDRYYFVIQQKYLPQIQSTKFAILDEVREINIGNEIPVTLCIGVGVNGSNYAQNVEWSRNAIELALGRGGDQAVVKDHDKISYYGGKTKQVEKSTRVRARVKAHALKQLLEGKERVMIMGHKIGDVDSFGSAIGVYRAARTLNKDAHIVINELTTNVRMMKSEFENNPEYASDMFLNESEAMEMIDLNTALIVVDVNRPSYTECPALLTKTKTIVILDHHRQSSENIENAVLSYIEPYASSACEMVAEILQYITDGVRLRPAEANAMYAGLLIDTNNFINKTGVRTFEAAAYLRKNGADIIKVKKMFRDDLKIYKIRAAAVERATIFDNEFAFAECRPEGVESPTVVGAQVANELMNITGVKASFVFTEVKGTIYVSARSFEEVNVQLVMEKFGGGGHSAIAGAQLTGISVEAAMTQVKMQLRIMKNEGEI